MSPLEIVNKLTQKPMLIDKQAPFLGRRDEKKIRT
jgi:hypothetical protein